MIFWIKRWWCWHELHIRPTVLFNVQDCFGFLRKNWISSNLIIVVLLMSSPSQHRPRTYSAILSIDETLEIEMGFVCSQNVPWISFIHFHANWKNPKAKDCFTVKSIGSNSWTRVILCREQCRKKYVSMCHKHV